MVFAEYLLTDNNVHYKGNSSMLENFCFIINQLYLIFRKQSIPKNSYHRTYRFVSYVFKT